MKILLQTLVQFALLIGLAVGISILEKHWNKNIGSARHQAVQPAQQKQ